LDELSIIYEKNHWLPVLSLNHPGSEKLPREIYAFPAAEFRSQKVLGSSQLESKFFESFQWDEFRENLQEDFSVFLNVLHIFMVCFLQILHQSSGKAGESQPLSTVTGCQRFGVEAPQDNPMASEKRLFSPWIFSNRFLRILVMVKYQRFSWIIQWIND